MDLHHWNDYLLTNQNFWIEYRFQVLVFRVAFHEIVYFGLPMHATSDLTVKKESRMAMERNGAYPSIENQ